MTRLSAAGEPIQVLNPEGHPSAFDWRGERHQIVEVNRCWRVDVGWWDPNVCTNRQYWEVVTDTGVFCLIHQELPEGEWFLSRIYD